MSQQQVAIYARVSSKQQADEGTVESQLAALQQRVEQDGFHLSGELTFVGEHQAAIVRLLGLGCQIQALTAGFGNPAGATERAPLSY
jgi:hypothetical protein